MSDKFNLSEELQKNDLISEVMAIFDLDPLTREQERNRISEEFNVRKRVIDDFIKGFKKGQKAGGTTEIVTEVEPAVEKILGDKLLSTIRDVLKKHIILPAGVAEPIAAWVVLTYCHNAFRILPILGIVSPVKRCGKTTLLEILSGMTNKALIASNITPAAVFRTIEKYEPTLLVDEADTYLKKDNEELKAVLNSGHTRKSAFVVRVQGEEHEPVKFSTWGPKAISMIGNLPDTLQDRSIVVSLRRKAPGETVSKLNFSFEQEADEIRRACCRWAGDNLDILKGMNPDMPQTNNDRMTDNWTPLICIADAAGGPWPELMRKSMCGMIDGNDDSIGPKLLKDIKAIFESHPDGRIFSGDLVKELTELKESPWCDWRKGKGLTQNGLARLLKLFGIKSKNMRTEDKVKKGYELHMFKDSFQRYIPLTPPISSATPLQDNKIKGLNQKQNATKDNHVADKKQPKLLKSNDCSGVADENPISEGKEEKDPVLKCDNCPAHDNGQCFARAYFKGKPGKPVPCAEAVKNCDRSY